jgi:adenylate cyclase
MLIFTLANERQRRQIHHLEGPLEFGRLQQGACARFVVDDPYTSRDQLRVEELPGGKVRLTNLGAAITLADGSKLEPAAVTTLAAPLRLTFGCTTLEISAIPNEDQSGSPMQTIARPLAAPAESQSWFEARDRAARPPVSPGGAAPSADTLAQWFETLLAVQKSAAGSNEFYAETARAVVGLVGLDRGLVLLRRAGAGGGPAWEVVASHSTGTAPGSTAGIAGADRQYSQRVLNQVLAERRTWFQCFAGDSGHGQSLAGIEAVVGSPVFGERGDVVGVVYGSRDMRTAGANPRGIEPLEAQFVQVLAGAVSAGLARVGREAEAARARVQFEEFFSPELAQALARDPAILAAQERELTLLFADLRGFSRLSERIGAAETYSLLTDILSRFTNQIMDEGGVVIDYYGDGLAAMWNAPLDTPEHADRAARAALGIARELPAINAVWSERLLGQIRAGIGIHSGRAQVGNAGSRRRFKYGPRGHAINLASRVEAATKVFGVPCLITGATRALLQSELPLRRICRARLTGMTEPVELFELPTFGDQPTWLALCAGYEQALALFERGDVAGCGAACRELQSECGASDGPTQWLLRQAEQRLAAGIGDGSGEPWDGVFAVETK